MLRYIYRIIFGTVRILIFFEYPEKAINLLYKNGIVFWNIKKTNDGYKITAFSKDEDEIFEILKNNKIKANKLFDAGIPVILSKYKHRWGILVGLSVLFVGLNFLSGRIWIINVNGCEAIKEDEVISALTDMNIKCGVSNNIKNGDLLKQKLLLKLEKAAWASVNAEGCVLNVNITEIKNADYDFTRSDLISNEDAIIKKIDVTSGKTIVKVGQTVHKNQILVSNISGTRNDTIFERSIGKIIGEVIKDYEYCIPKKLERREYKKPYCLNSIDCFNIRLPLSLKIPNGRFESVTKENNCTFFGGEIPIKIYQKEIREYDVYFDEIDENTALQFAEEKLKSELNNAEVEYFNVFKQEFFDEKDEYKFIFTVKYQKNIAFEQKI